MARPAKMLPGVYSQVGRHTDHEIQNLASRCEGIGEDAAEIKAESPKAERSHSPKGALAAAIKERVRQNLAASEAAAAAVAAAAAASVEQETQTQSKHVAKLSASFANQGMEAWWTTKHGGDNDVGAINRRNEQKPDCIRYTPQYRAVRVRYPQWDISKRPPHIPGAPGQRRSKSPSSSPTSPQSTKRGAVTFLTEAETFQYESHAEKMAALRNRDSMALTARERAMLALENEPPMEKVQPMAVNSLRPELGKVGRVHIIGQDVSHPAEDLHKQDIKGYHKLRYPEWNFGTCSSRKPLQNQDAMSCPGQYDVNYDSVKPKLLSGIPYDRAQTRDVCVRNLCYIALPRVLHPDEEGTQKTSSTLRRPLPDRSYSKDAVRHRPVHVNNFDRDAWRKPLLSGSKEYHDESDPEVCRKTLERSLSFDIDRAIIPVTKRRDVGPDYARMIPRGKSAVMANRGLSDDLAVRGSVGLGFVETTGQTKDVESLEARKSAGSRPDVGPKFSNTTFFKPTKDNRGSPHVHAPAKGHSHAHAPSPAEGDKRGGPRNAGNQTNALKAFERESQQLPGYCARLGGGSSISRSRTYEALPSWGKEPLPD